MPNDIPMGLEATPASSWNSPRLRGFVVELPSGNNARLRRSLSLIDAVKNDTIPNPLANRIKTMMNNGEVGIDIKDLEPVAVVQWFAMIDDEMLHIFIDPTVVRIPDGENPATWEAPEGSILLTDLSPEDKSFAYSFAQGGVNDVASFRKAATAMATGADVREVRDASLAADGIGG